MGQRRVQRSWGKVAAASRRGEKRLRRPKSIWPFRLAPLLFLAAGIFVVGALAYSVIQSQTESIGTSAPEIASADDGPDLPGTYFPPHSGADAKLDTADDRAHIRPGVPIPLCSTQQIALAEFNNPVCYASNPPTSGPHSSSPMPFRILDNPAPKESLVHNMEHGGVVVWVNTTNARVLAELESTVEEALDRRRLVVMSPYTDMAPETIALTSWTRLELIPVPEFDKALVDDFIAVHQRRFNPEGF